MIVDVHLEKKIIFWHQDSNTQFSDRCLLAAAIHFLKIFADLQLITLHQLVAGTLGDLLLVTKTTTVVTGNITLILFVQKSRLGTGLLTALSYQCQPWQRKFRY